MGIWEEPRFEGLEDKLQEFVKTEEFTADHCKALVRALQQAAHIAA